MILVAVRRKEIIVRLKILAAVALLLPGLLGIALAVDPATQPAHAPSSRPAITSIPIGPAYAGTQINATVFRVNALVTSGEYQFVTYYAPDGSVVVGRRKPPDANWDLATLAFKGNVSDAHNVVVIGVSSDGLLHLSYDHHAQPLHYRISQKPLDIRSFGPERPMTGQTEQHVTYPQFVNAPDGTLYYFYRDGASGNGSLCVNRYDAATQSWTIIAHPLIDGLNRCNPYWWRPSFAADGALHLAWCWRDTPDAQTNHDLCYAASPDGGKTWRRSDGKPQTIPITPDNAEIVDPIRKNSNLINQCSSAVDAAGRPHLVQYFNDPAGIPQFFHIWFDGKSWQRNQVSQRTGKFSLSGSGSLAIPISRPEIAITRDNRVTIICRDAEFGGGVRLYRANAPYEKWDAIDLTHDDLGNWEPQYDLNRFRAGGILDLFLLAVRQGNHETATDFAPQQASLLEVNLNQ
jgi:hypothetical protein